MESDIKEFTQKDCFIHNNSLRKEYSRNDEEFTLEVQKKLVYWGQRKLLINELLWLVYHWSSSICPNPIFVYVGSMPGTHMNMLMKMFPTFEYHFFDKSRSAYGGKVTTKWEIKEDIIKLFGDRLKLIEEYFTNEHANFYAKNYPNRAFFCSDMRNPEYDSFNGDLTRNQIREANKIVVEDMELQKRWVKIMRPVSSSLKMRFAWPEEAQDRNIYMPYFTGKMYFQPWSKATSSELRLIVDMQDLDLPERRYSIKIIESIMFKHNIIRGTEKFYVNIQTEEGEKKFHSSLGEYSDDWNSCYEIFVFNEYLTKFNYKGSRSTMIDQLCKMANNNISFSTKRTISSIASQGSSKMDTDGMDDVDIPETARTGVEEKRIITGASESFAYFENISDVLKQKNRDYFTRVMYEHQDLQNVIKGEVLEFICLKLKNITDMLRLKRTVIVDLISGIGFNSLNFSTFFNEVFSIENIPERFSCLNGNIKVFGVKNCNTVKEKYNIWISDYAKGFIAINKGAILYLNIANYIDNNYNSPQFLDTKISLFDILNYLLSLDYPCICLTLKKEFNESKLVQNYPNIDIISSDSNIKHAIIGNRNVSIRSLTVIKD